MRTRVWAPLLAGLVACATPDRPAPVNPTDLPASAARPGRPAPANPSAPSASSAQPADAPVPPASREPDDIGDPPRHGATVAITPPPPPAPAADGWLGSPRAPTYCLACLRWSEVPPTKIRQGRRSRVALRSLSVEGRLTKSITTRIVRGRQDDVQNCHLRAMDATPELAGEVSLRLDIDASGRVLNLVVSGVDPTRSCVRDAASRWIFPPGADPLRITATFELTTTDAARDPEPRARCLELGPAMIGDGVYDPPSTGLAPCPTSPRPTLTP